MQRSLKTEVVLLSLVSSGTSLYISVPVFTLFFVCFVWIIYKLFRRRPCFTICLYGVCVGGGEGL